MTSGKFLLCIQFLICGFGFAVQDTIELHVRNGNLTLFDGNSVAHLVYTQSDAVTRNSDILILNENQDVLFRLINNDDEAHGLEIPGLLLISSVLPDDTADVAVTLTNPGIFRYSDPVQNFRNAYLGLSGVLHVKSIGDTYTYYYWDLRELSPAWFTELNVNNTVDPSFYSPEYFQINGNSSPDIDNDPLAKITGAVGQDIRLVIVNNGQSIHAMHFHGYHAALLKNSKDPSHEGRSKDTFPVYPWEHVLLSIVPDKPGLYPVHDHNLVAVTGGGVYHAGMFTTLEITP